MDHSTTYRIYFLLYWKMNDENKENEIEKQNKTKKEWVLINDSDSDSDSNTDLLLFIKKRFHI